MTDLREKIAQAIADAPDLEGMPPQVKDQYAAADAILYTIKESIPPLEWEIDEQEGDALAESILGPFNVYYDDGHGWLVQRDGHDDTWVKYPEADFGFPDRAEAIKYVDDYYERRILSALVGGESA